MISWGLFSCSTSQPFRSQSSKLILIPDQIYSGPFKDRRQEMVVCSELRPEFVRRINRGIDLTAKDFLRRLEARDDFRKSDIADNQKIYIAPGTFLSLGYGAVDKRHLNMVGTLSQSGAQGIADSRRFEDQALKLMENGRLGICLKIYLLSAYRAADNSSI